MSMSTSTKWIIGIGVVFVCCVGLFFVLMIAFIFNGEGLRDETTSTSGVKIAVVELKEPIYSSESIVRQFKKYRENRSVKAIVFRVDSPGGGVAASQEIYEEVKKTRESGKPVVVSMGSVAASGGYYVACGADVIVANPGTLTGSIGVIMQFMHVDELLRKVGVDESTYKSGKFKDAGSMYRKPNPGEREYFEGLIADVYDQFVGVVAEERGMEISEVKQYADGRVFTGRQAYSYGLVDTLGTYEDAVSIAAKLGHIYGKPDVVKETKRRTWLGDVFDEAATSAGKIREEFLAHPMLQYRLTSPN